MAGYTAGQQGGPIVGGNGVVTLSHVVDGAGGIGRKSGPHMETVDGVLGRARFSADTESQAVATPAANAPDYEYLEAQTPRDLGATNAHFESPTRKKLSRNQLVAEILGVLVFLVCLILMVLVKFENNSAGVVYGFITTLFCSILIFISYTCRPENQKHPNKLFICIAVVDLILAIRLAAEVPLACILDGGQCEPISEQADYSALCTAMGVIAELLLLSSECFFFCLSLDMYWTLKNPFTDYKANMRKYYWFSIGFPILLGVIMLATDSAGEAVTRQCWVKDEEFDPDDGSSEKNGITNANWRTWLFLYVWLGIFLVASAVIIGKAMIAKKGTEVMEFKRRLINTSKDYCLVVLFYWLAVFISYMIYIQTADLSEKNNWAGELVKFLIAAKGYGNFVVWFWYNELGHRELMDMLCSSKSRRSSSVVAVDAELNLQLNEALRNEILHYTTEGIRRALTDVSFETKDKSEFNFSKGTSSRRGPKFIAFKPRWFRQIRSAFGVSNESMLASLRETAKARISEGASGAFMFFSKDNTLIVKSMSTGEKHFLVDNFVMDYAQYLDHYRDSLLTRFYGCYCLHIYDRDFYFVVMANLFNTDKTIHTRYDIKGSWVNRNAERPKKGKKVTCRHCNQKYIHGIKVSAHGGKCPVQIGGHEPNVVLKDMDLKGKLLIAEEVAFRTFHTIKRDTEFLKQHGIMDYSLLVGVSNHTFPVDHSAEGYNEPDSIESLTRGASAYIGGRGTTQGNRTLPEETRATGNMASGSIAPLLAAEVVGAKYYFVGIIDILQTWTFQKRMERFFKVKFQGKDRDGLSAIPPGPYWKRFMDRAAEVFGVPLSKANEDEEQSVYFQPISLA